MYLFVVMFPKWVIMLFHAATNLSLYGVNHVSFTYFTNNGISPQTLSKWFRCTSNLSYVFEYIMLFHWSMTRSCLSDFTYSLHFMLTFFKCETYITYEKHSDTPSQWHALMQAPDPSQWYFVATSQNKTTLSTSLVPMWNSLPFHVPNMQKQLKTSILLM